MEQSLITLPLWTKDYKKVKAMQEEVDEAIRVLEGYNLFTVKKDKQFPGYMKRFYVENVRVIRAGQLIHVKPYHRIMTEEEMRIIMNDLTQLFQVPYNCIGFTKVEVTKENENGDFRNILYNKTKKDEK